MSENTLAKQLITESLAEVAKYREDIIAEYGDDVQALTNAFAIRVYKEQHAKRLSDSALGMFTDASLAHAERRDEVMALKSKLSAYKSAAERMAEALGADIVDYLPEGVSA